MAAARIKGVLSPVVTPFKRDLSPDVGRFIAHCKWLISQDCGLAVFGTNSEANSLSARERMNLLEAVVAAGVPTARMMPGTGACSITEAAEVSAHAVKLGVGGVLMLPPFYYKNPSEDGLFRFFADVIEDVGDNDLKVYLYHIPPVAQVGFSLPLIERLLKAYPRTIVGLKDSSGDWSNTKAILETFPSLEVFPGSEAFLLDALRLGGAGCISASANVAAKSIRRVFDNWQGGDADKLQAEVSALRLGFQKHPLIPLLKAIVAHYRKDPEWANVRPPFMPMPAEEAAAAIRTLAEQHNFRLDFSETA